MNEAVKINLTQSVSIMIFHNEHIQMQPLKTVRGITYVCTERVFDSRLLLYNIIFLEKKPLIEGCSSHFYASFGTFYAKIGRLFEA